MSMRILLEGDFARYFDPARTQNAFWLFQHVPKTAGSSLREELVHGLSEFRPETNIHVDGTDPAIPWHDRMDAAVATFKERMPGSNYRFVSGHLFERHVTALREVNLSTRAFTFLRDPITRFISDYRYQRSKMNPGHESFRRDVPSLDAFVELGWNSDAMARHLLPISIRQQKDGKKSLDYMIDNFEFVGLQDQYEFSFSVLSRLLGFRSNPTIRERTNPPSAENPTDFDAILLSKLEAANALDQELFTGIQSKLRDIQPNLLDWMKK